jgi:protein-L-isoaspartate(D-aspartate) O-methyltransferase
VPDALVAQLALGGRMLIPVGDRSEQKLVLYRRTENGVESEELIRCTFVPLIGRFGWSEGK